MLQKFLQQYEKRGSEILSELQEYKHTVREIEDKIFDKNLVLPLDSKDKSLDDSHKRIMCFIDGGEGIRELLGAGLYFIRASGLVYNGNLNENSFVREMDLGIIDYDDHITERVQLLRGAMEFDVAIKCIETHNPKYIFLDGSLYVNAKKRHSASECEEYEIYRKKFFRLLKICDKDSIHIAGVSEDSESRLFVNYMANKYDIKLPKFMTDSSVLQLLCEDLKNANKNFNGVYRTSEFIPQTKFEVNDYEIEFPTVYLQPTPLSNPLRIDVPNREKNFDKIIGLIVSMSTGSKQYGYPLPLYLVHLDAKIKETQTEWATNQLISYISKRDKELYDAILREKRRMTRPE